MNTYPIEININIQRVEDLRIKLNGKEYALIPIVDNEEEEHRPDDAPTLAVFVEQLIQDLRREGRVRTSETYHGALASFKKFLQGKDIAISAIDSTLIANYEHHLKEQGLISNSTSFYMRVLRTIYKGRSHERCQYREGLRIVNAMLKPVGRKAGLNEPLTMYVARHSWASIARSMNVPLNIISQGMGHTSEQTTQIYLKSLSNKGRHFFLAFAWNFR